MILSRLLLGLVTLGLLAASDAAAQDAAADFVASDPALHLEGNWYVEWHDSPETGLVERAAFTLSKPWKETCRRVASGGCRYLYERDESSPWSLAGWVHDGYQSGIGRNYEVVSAPSGVQIDHGYGILGDWGGTSAVGPLGVSPDTMVGRWSYDTKGGREIWRRARPRIDRVEFQSNVVGSIDPASVGLVEVTYPGGFWWGPGNSSRGNRSGFTVRIFGDDLWGHHVVALEDHDVGACPWEYGCGLEVLWDTIRSDTSGGPGGVIGIAAEVVIWPGALPGRKTLYFDSIPIPFEFLVNGYPYASADLVIDEPSLDNCGVGTIEIQDDPETQRKEYMKLFNEYREYLLSLRREAEIEHNAERGEDKSHLRTVLMAWRAGLGDTVPDIASIEKQPANEQVGGQSAKPDPIQSLPDNGRGLPLPAAVGQYPGAAEPLQRLQETQRKLIDLLSEQREEWTAKEADAWWASRFQLAQELEKAQRDYLLALSGIMTGHERQARLEHDRLLATIEAVDKQIHDKLEDYGIALQVYKVWLSEKGQLIPDGIAQCMRGTGRGHSEQKVQEAIDAINALQQERNAIETARRVQLEILDHALDRGLNYADQLRRAEGTRDPPLFFEASNFSGEALSAIERQLLGERRVAIYKSQVPYRSTSKVILRRER